jgi:DNA-binding NarL/FixJ family response regulator
MEKEKIRILLVEDNKDFAKLVQVYLQRFDKDKFEIVWKENYTETMKELDANLDFHIILMDYFLPGRNGFEITKELKAKKITIPIVFLTVNKDIDLALDIMKLGVDDYLVKEEISSPVLPRTVLSVIEKRRLSNQLIQIEISQQRLKIITETIAAVANDFEIPLKDMKELSGSFTKIFGTGEQQNFHKIIDDNINRLVEKLDKLKSLKDDKTVKYIKDIKMLDLSSPPS